MIIMGGCAPWVGCASHLETQNLASLRRHEIVWEIQYCWRCLKYGAENQAGLNYVDILTALRVPSPWILAFSVETHGVRL